MKYQILIAWNLLACGTITAISMVYNFRIAQITKQPLFERSGEREHTLIALLFDQYRKKYTGTRQNYAGGLGSYIYDVNQYYLRIDMAASHIQDMEKHTTTFSGTEMDDILLTIGRNFVVNEKAVVTLSGLFGIPTHKVYRLQHPDFGYSQVGTGVQLDGSYALTSADDLLYGARYLYFVPRNACDTLGQRHKITIGNVGDLLLAYKHAWTKHGIEFGYTFRSRFGSAASPCVTDFSEKTNYLRSNFYGVYKYKFFVGDVAHRLLFNLGYGFDHRSKKFGDRAIVTLWASWNIRF